MDIASEVNWDALQCLCAVGVVVGVLFYRMSVLAALHWHYHPIIHDNAMLIVSFTAACINLVAILILKFVSDWLQLMCLSRLITQRRSVAKSIGCFQRRLFVCGFAGVFVNTITSE